jgi:protein-tyrosine-phosphatase
MADDAPGSPSPASRRPQSVLFMCAQNAVRSPMAEGLTKHFFGRSLYVQSAGVRTSEPDAFMLTVMDELGIDARKHRPRTVEELEDWEGLNFDLIITLSPEAHHKALELTRTMATDVEYWPTPDPTIVQGSRDQMLDAYRAVRDGLAKKIKDRLR